MGTKEADRCDLLVVAAFAPELEGMQSILGSGMQAEVGGVLVFARPVGIGLVAAASGTATRLEAHAPHAVVLVGTCGAYPGSGLAIGDIAVARTIALIEPSVLEGRAAFPDPMSARVDPHAAMTAAIATAGAALVDLSTTLAVTTDDALAASLARRGAAEHLEAFAVATACAAKNIPFAAVLGVANAVGSRGRSQWRENHASAGDAAATFVARWIQAGAAGVPHRQTARL
jgi:futalosine hydrolase